MLARLVVALALALLAGPLLPAAADDPGFARHYPYTLGPLTFPGDEDAHLDLGATPTDLLGQGPGDSVIEWWYLGMHLRDAQGHGYGVMQAFLQYNRMDAEAIFDVTAPDEPRFAAHDLLSNELDLGPPAGHLDRHVGENALEQVAGEPFVYQLHAVGDGTQADLRLVAVEAPYLPHGGSFHMGPGDVPANLAGYYVIPRLEVAGDLVLDGAARHVEGVAVLDHAWYYACTCAYNEWDYFPIVLDNGAGIVAYQFYDGELSARRYDVGFADGTQAWGDDFGLQELGYWQKHPLRTPSDGDFDLDDVVPMLTSKLYSHGWRLELPEAGLDLTVLPVMDDQEAHRGNVAQTFYEGQSTVTGTWHDVPVRGMGFGEVWHDHRPDVLPVTG
ncbi:MAG: hypothetical protein LC624_06160 [Halobacteriales archaeon]|nr:hypothetical protein [Halobacteriales archaeon]